MTNHPWKPPPETLSAYLDGEVDRETRERIEEHLAADPNARAELEAMRRLQAMLRETAPAEPSAVVWQRALARATPAPPRRTRGAALWVGAACVLLGFTLGAFFPAKPDEPWPVVGPRDVEILSVEGRDLTSVVVGRLPLEGDLTLADPGEVEVLSSPSVPNGPRVATVRVDAGLRPMIWAKLDSEEP